MSIQITRGLTALWVLTAPMAGWAAAALPVDDGQATDTMLFKIGYEDLAEKDQRRLVFYADRIVKDLMAWSTADTEGKVEETRRIALEIVEISSRLISAGLQYGLTPSEVEEIFRDRFVLSFTGRLPAFMLGERGIAGVSDLLTLELNAPTGTVSAEEGDDYIDSIRSVGETLFGE